MGFFLAKNDVCCHFYERNENGKMFWKSVLKTLTLI